MKLLVIYNPHAGNGRAKGLLTQVRNTLQQQQLSADIQLTQRIGHAVELVANADLSQYEAVIASGGDGTLFEVVNGYYQNKAINKPPIGLIPNGTGNAFMKELGLQKSDWKKAIELIRANNTRTIDVGQLQAQGRQHYFLNIVGMGFVSQVAQAAIPLKWMGNAAYTAATLQKLIKLKPQQIQLEIDGRELQREGIFVEVANSKYTGASFLMAPKARLDDGLLDVVLLNNISRLRLLRLFTSIYDGSHVNYPEVEYFQASTINIIEENPAELIPDGEVIGRTPAAFQCVAADLKFIWDKQFL